MRVPDQLTEVMDAGFRVRVPPVVGLNNHPHVVEIPYLERLRSRGAQGDGMGLKRSPTPAEAGVDHQNPRKIA